MTTLRAELEKHYQPDRFAEVEQLHRNAFAWRPQGRIPLGVHVADPKHIRGVGYDQRLDPEVFFEIHGRYLLDTLAVGSDLLPVTGMNHLGDVLVPTMFGAEQFVPEEMSATLQDVGPTPMDVLDSIEEVENLSAPPMDAGIRPQVEAMGRYYRQHLPEWVRVVGTMPTGALTTAMELRGSGLMLDLVDQPELCMQLMMLCTETVARAEMQFRRATDTPTSPYFTNFGVAGAGLRLGDDSICNLSGEMIRRFCGPTYRRTCELWGGGAGHVHCCSLEHRRLEHLYPAMAEMPEVAVLSTQFGFEYYQEHVEDLRGRLAIESFYGDAYGYIRRKHGSFRDWANEFVPRFKNESGLVLYCQVPSVNEGREVWSLWQEAHRR